MEVQTEVPQTGLTAKDVQKKERIVSNEMILWMTMWMFAIFVIAEVCGGLFSNSLALLGDAAAMSVDVVTYICNIHAERVKQRSGVVSDKTKMLTEVYIPIFSLLALVAVSAWITFGAMNIIINPSSNKDDVKVLYLYIFSSLNMFVDVCSGILFYAKRKTVFSDNSRLGRVRRASTISIFDDLETGTDEDIEPIILSTSLPNNTVSINLNMLTAGIHVSGDTLRTFAVFFAALIATSGANSSLCDAWATVVSTITILGMVIYAAMEIHTKYNQTKYVRI